MTCRSRYRSGIVDARAYCIECKGTDEPLYWSTNAMGLGAQHHDRTGHEVRIEQSIIVIYGGDRAGQVRRFVDGVQKVVSRRGVQT